MKKLAALVCLVSLAATAVQAQSDDDDEDEDEATLVYGETVVVTASRQEETIADAPVSVTVIGGERLEAAPADNYADLLRGVPGLNVVQTSARDLNFTSRGATSTLSTAQLALIDGRSIYQDFFGFVMWDVLPVALDEVQQIEVVRGPGSAKWGANALNGVINVRTRTPRELDGGQAMFTVGEVGTYGGSFRWADAMEEWSYKLSGSYSEQDPWERADTLPSGEPLPLAAQFENEGTEQPKFDARFDFEPEPGQLWSFQGGYAATSGIIHTGIGPFRVDDSSAMGYLQAAMTRGSLEGKFYVNLLDGEAKNVLNGLDFFFDTQTYVGDLVDRRVFGSSNVLVYGGNIRQNQFDLSIAPRDDSRTELGFFVEDQILLGDKAIIGLGGRADWFDTIGWTFSPRTSLILKPYPDHSLRFAYNRAYRSPSLVNNFLDTAIFNQVTLPTGLFVFPTAAVGNEDLDEEIVDAFEVAWTFSVAERATFSVAWYRNVTQDLIDFFPATFYSAADPPPGWPLPPAFVPPFTLPKSFTYRNVGEVVDTGIELTANVAIAPGVCLSGSYAWQDEPDVTQGDTVIPLGTNIPPRHQFGFSLSAVKDPVFASFGVTWTDEAFWQDVLDERFWGPTDSFALVSATLGYKFGPNNNLSLAVKATNLLDEAAQQHVFGDIIRRKVSAEVRVNF